MRPAISGGAARRRVLLVVAVLAAGALAFGASLLLRGDAGGQRVEVAATPAAPSPSLPPASYTNPRGADAEPCEPADATPGSTATPRVTPPEPEVAVDGPVAVTLVTTCGDVELLLDPDAAPLAVDNFVGLAGVDYYLGTGFHRVSDGFMVQGGDPTGSGTGCVDADCQERLPGYTLPDELGAARALVEEVGGYPRGTVAMANRGPDTAGSQFFIVQAEPGYPLPPAYTVFGRVTAGMDVVDRIAQGPVDGDRALAPVVVTDVVVDP